MKRILIISDLHCGHRAGLTPPGWQYPENDSDHERETFARNQRIMWDWFTRKVDSLKPIDFLFINGDSLDGKGERSGGTEQLEADRSKQVEIAAEAIKYIGADKIVMLYGTSYHTGKEEDWELVLSRMVNAEKIGGHEWPEVEGLVFDLKHHVSGSIIPHGRYTSIAREDLWNALWAEHNGQPRADVIVRSHVHYFAYQGRDGHLGIITPALQGWGSKFGIRRCSGMVDIGFLSFDVNGKEDYSWWAHLLKPESASEMILKL